MPVVEELERFKRDNSAMPEYYKAWDKFAKKLDDEYDEDGSLKKAPSVPFTPQPEPTTA